MKSTKIDINDSGRVLLTDLLPYETPVVFTNEGLYHVLNNFDGVPIPIKSILETKSYKVPYTYSIKNGVDKLRELSVIHPAIQRQFIDFYENNYGMILYQCSRSPFTLRAPVSVASRFYEEPYAKGECLVNEGVEVEREGDVDQVKHSSSYFAYKKYNFLYKFYDSYEFIRLEKRFEYLHKIDISKCFSSIYTHSISWAVKSKKWAKANIGRNTFENNFDKLMQVSNYNETNGIVIGPEVSRIFAEIILQSIDLAVLEELEACGLQHERDYAVRRYIDDFFIFYNSQNDKDTICKAFQKQFLKYRFYINDTKTTTFPRPFITNITTAKTAINWLCERKLSSLFELEKCEDTDGCGVCSYAISRISSPSRKSNLLIRDIKVLVSEHGIAFSDISSYFLSILRRHFNKITASKYVSDGGGNDRKLLSLILFYLDVTFFLYSMDVKVRTTYIITQIVVVLAKFVDGLSEEIKFEVTKKVIDESMLILKCNDHRRKDSKIEILNLLIALKELGDEHLFNSEFLQKIFFDNPISGDSLTKQCRKLDYFQLVVILYYIGDSQKHTVLANAIIDSFIETLDGEPDPFLYAEYTCFFFDLLSWPHITPHQSESLLKTALRKLGYKRFDPVLITSALDYISQRKWFISWGQRGQLLSMLKKKELKAPY